jgi:GNAT superfamily N-acetyltransferase
MVTTTTQTKMRPFSLDDAQTVVDLINAHSKFVWGYEDCDLNEMIIDWTSPGIDIAKDIRVVEDQHGKIIGYIDVWDTTKPHVTKYVWGVLHPDAWDEDLYARMLAWAESRARERVQLAPEGARVIINHGLSSNDQRRNTALETYGFTLVRNFYRMVIELDHPLQQPVIPDGLSIVPIDMETELKPALIAMEDAFQDHWGFVERPIEETLKQWQHYIENSEDFDPSLWYLAKDGEQIAGICRCSGKMNEDPDMGWVSQLCVRKPWRRQGLGMALLLTSFHEFSRRGKKRVGLGVDASSLTNATRLYEKAGMHVTQKSNTYELELRPGKNLSNTG